MAPNNVLYDLLDFDVDRYLNPYIPHNRLYILPKPISHFLGYRPEPSEEPYGVLQWPITALATVAGLCLVSGIENYAPGIAEWHPPVIIASFGASAILQFNACRSPLAQPRHAIIGNVLAATCGVAVAKLFQHSANFENIQWLSAAVGCALASWVMSLTNTIHPPGGATAVLASTETMVITMGWRLVPIVLMDSVLMTIIALIFNNILRQYPMHWWTSENVGRKYRQEREKTKAAEQGEAGAGGEAVPSRQVDSDTSSDRTLRRELSNRVDSVGGLERVCIKSDRIELPHHVTISEDEMALLEGIQKRLFARGETG